MESIYQLVKRLKKLPIEERGRALQKLDDSTYDKLSNKTYTMVEFEVRTIDENGDVINICHFDSEALGFLEFGGVELNDEVKAVALEKSTKHIRLIDEDVEDVDYEELDTTGDPQALKLWRGE